MTRIIMLLAVSLSLTACATRTAEWPAGIAEAERAFAADADTRGLWTAFRKALAWDAVIFRPGPVMAQTWLADRPDPVGKLEWAPAIAETACSGDLGWDTGPFIQTAGNGRKSYGHFLSMWRRDGDGPWRVVADHGITHAGPVQLPRTTATPAGVPACRDSDTNPVDDANPGLKASKQAFMLMAAQNVADAYARWGAPDLRLHRDNSLPATDPAATRALLARGPQSMTMLEAGGDISRDRRLSYDYGTVEWQKGDLAYKGHWLRVWRRMPEGWRIAVDQIVASPRPA